MDFEKNISKTKHRLSEKYKELTKFFFKFMIDNNITFNNLNEIKKDTKIFKDFIVENREDSIIISKDNIFIEITFVIKNTFKKKKINNSEDFNLEKLKEGDILDITFMKNNEYYLFLSDFKEIIIQEDDFKGVYSPIKKDWHASISINDDFYEKALIFEEPCKQIHYIKYNKDGSFYKLIELEDNKFMDLEYYENKKTVHYETIYNTELTNNKLKKPKFD